MYRQDQRLGRLPAGGVEGGDLPPEISLRMKSRVAILLNMLLTAVAGCSMLPEIAHQPTLHNPFPQLSKVAIAPFFNLSQEPTLDGRQFAEAYFHELQAVPGFEVVPVGVVEQAILRHQVKFNGATGPDEARRLAQALGVDAVVIGAVTDYSPYYPPRCAMQVEWYAANPCFHPIPPGYGLPWATPAAKQIPEPLIFEAEFALAKSQLETQTPKHEYTLLSPAGVETQKQGKPGLPVPPQPNPPPTDRPAGASAEESAIKKTSHAALAMPASSLGLGTVADGQFGLPPDWPDPNGLIPSPPRTAPLPCCPTTGPVLRHTRTYHGNDPEFTEALAGYYFFRDDARFGGWQSYLERSEDFIRFCCHMHIWETFSARGGAGETRVVWRWPDIR